nr:hypothetical protein [Tanacetum cinerariifolium]
MNLVPKELIQVVVSGAKKPWEILLLKPVFVVEQEVVKDVNANVVEEVVNAAHDSTATTTITIEEITLTQALEALKTSKLKVKGIVIHEQEEPEHVKPKKKDQIRLDEEAAKRLQAEFDEEERLNVSKQTTRLDLCAFSFSNRRLELTATYSISTISEYINVIDSKRHVEKNLFDQADLFAKVSSSTGVKHLIPSRLTRYLNLSSGKALVNRSANCWTRLHEMAMAAFESQYIDEFIKSCVENLVPNSSESEGENGCDVPACFTTFSNVLFDADYEFDSSDDQSLHDEDVPEKIFSNPLFEEEIIPMKIDQHHFNAESDRIEIMLNHDSSIVPSSLKIDSLLNEFASELTLLKSIPLRINETDCYPEKDIHLIERLLYDNSSPRPPKEFVSEYSNAEIKSFSPTPIPVEDSDPLMEEIDLSFTPDDPMPPSIKDDDYDSERDILILKDLPSNYSISLPKNESFHLIFFRSLVLLQNHQMPSAKCPMMIHGKNIPILDVLLFHFYPLDQLKYGGNWVKLSDLKQALRGRHPVLIIVQYFRKLEDSCQRI